MLENYFKIERMNDGSEYLTCLQKCKTSKHFTFRLHTLAGKSFGMTLSLFSNEKGNELRRKQKSSM